MPKLLCPVCSIWPIFRERVVVGQLISRSSQPSNFIRHLTSGGASINWPAADRFGTHSRRGAAWALVSAGGTFDQLFRAGQWRGNAVRAKLDRDEDERRAMTDILIGGSDVEPS